MKDLSASNECIVCGGYVMQKIASNECSRCGHSAKLDAPKIDYRALSGRNLNYKLLKRKVESRIQYCDKYLKSARSLLEVGSAEGDFINAVKERYQIEEVTGVEPSLDSLSIKTSCNIKVYSDIMAIDTDKTFEIITCFHVLEHVRDIIGFVREMVKRLTDNGYLVLEVPNKNGADWKFSDSNKEHIHRFTYGSLAIVAESLNLSVISMESGVFESYSYPDSLRLTARKSRSTHFQKMKLGEWKFESKVYVWGIGEIFCDNIQPYLNSMTIAGFIDKNPSDYKFEGYRVYKPEDIDYSNSSDYLFVVASDRHFNQIHEDLEKAGIQKEKIFTVNDFIELLYATYMSYINAL
jgi:2-polyprenyl-3-methyl-5-hydroxy-6-metoxy-1,4-benzoquinol methylase